MGPWLALPAPGVVRPRSPPEPGLEQAGPISHLSPGGALWLPPSPQCYLRASVCWEHTQDPSSPPTAFTDGPLPLPYTPSPIDM